MEENMVTVEVTVSNRYSCSLLACAIFVYFIYICPLYGSIFLVCTSLGEEFYRSLGGGHLLECTITLTSYYVSIGNNDCDCFHLLLQYKEKKLVQYSGPSKVAAITVAAIGYAMILSIYIAMVLAMLCIAAKVKSCNAANYTI